MADSTHLLSHSYTPEIHDDDQDKVAVSSINDAIESGIGSTTTTHLLQAFIVALAWGFDSQQCFITIFTDAQPSWHCTNPDDPSCSSATNPCGLPDGSWAWDRPEHTSVISEWALECSSVAIAGLPASAFFVGCLAGGVTLTAIADSLLGRKTMLFLSCLTMSLSGALIAASPNLWVYSALRFLTGFGRAAVGTTATVLSTEIIGKRWRERVGVFGFVCSTFGFISLPAIAYACRESSWRALYLWTSIPCLCYSIALRFLIRESPRWLLVRGHREEAIVDVFSAMKILWHRRWALQRLATIMVVAFGVGVGYYGLPLNVGNLKSDLYLSASLNALSELPSCLISYFMIQRMNRRISLLLLTTLSGVCSILCIFLRGVGWLMVVEVVSFCSAGTAFIVLWIYTTELFPTCVKNSAISVLRQAIVLGGVFAPVLVAAGRNQGFLSFGVFGLVIGFCGLFVAWLPESRGKTISDTMEEEEENHIASAGYGP